MCRQKYEIVMQTAIGDRAGCLEAAWSNGIIKGIIQILDHTEPFSGQISEDGKCQVTGRIISLARIIPFAATGRITMDDVYLSLRGERNIFEIYGTAVHREC